MIFLVNNCAPVVRTIVIDVDALVLSVIVVDSSSDIARKDAGWHR